MVMMSSMTHAQVLVDDAGREIAAPQHMTARRWSSSSITVEKPDGLGKITVQAEIYKSHSSYLMKYIRILVDGKNYAYVHGNILREMINPSLEGITVSLPDKGGSIIIDIPIKTECNDGVSNKSNGYGSISVVEDMTRKDKPLVFTGVYRCESYSVD